MKYILLSIVVLFVNISYAEIDPWYGFEQPESWKELSAANFNNKLRVGESQKEKWSEVPLLATPLLVSGYWGEGSLRKVVEDRGSVHFTDQSDVHYIMSIAEDDSVTGEWYKFSWSRNKSSRSWNINKVEVAYRCARGDNPGKFQGRLCP
jgi:hypothetical protein